MKAWARSSLNGWKRFGGRSQRFIRSGTSGNRKTSLTGFFVSLPMNQNFTGSELVIDGGYTVQ